MKYTPDQYIYLDWGWGEINATLVFTWLIMALLAGGSWFISRRLSSTTGISGWQNLLEVIVKGINDHIEEVTHRDPGPFLPLIGTLFLFILVSNILSVIPFFQPPTGSLSTTAAYAVVVFLAVPVFGLSTQSLSSYLKQYIQPTSFMLPFNLLGDITRTFALAVRLYGNVMSSTVIILVLVVIIPLVIPVIMQLLGLLTGIIQAYIFALLAAVYIASAMKKTEEQNNQSFKGG
ncbi:MAG: F0F1 ATP synthase subunit A [Desulfurivibrionaceae bacterium]